MNGLLTQGHKLNRLVLALLVSASVAACGGSSSTITSAGISGTGVTQGTITGFGSIFVNGVRYEVSDDTVFDVDGTPINVATHQEDLKVGMVVRLDWTSFDDGRTEADSVIYDDSIEGPITSAITPIGASRKSFTVMGVTVEVDDSTTVFHDSTVGSTAFDFDTIAQNDVIEVSGFVDASGTVSATLIEKKGKLVAGSTDTPVEMRGAITNLPQPVGSAGSFDLNGVAINYDGATVLEDFPNGLQNDLVVEVKGTYNDTIPPSIQARKIENEDDDDLGSGSSSDQSFSVQGLIAGFVDSDTEFTINGIRVRVGTSVPAATRNQLANGLLVEVEGSIINNVLQANQVEIRESQAEYLAIVRSVNTTANTLSIGYLPPTVPTVGNNLEMTIDARSVILNEDNNPISLTDIQPGDDVKINARIMDASDVHLVVRLKRERGQLKSYEITGKVESASVSGNTITIDGLQFTFSPGAVYNIPGLRSGLEGMVGRVVELEDEHFVPGGRDGFIDEISIPD